MPHLTRKTLMTFSPFFYGCRFHERVILTFHIFKCYLLTSFHINYPKGYFLGTIGFCRDRISDSGCHRAIQHLKWGRFPGYAS